MSIDGSFVAAGTLHRTGPVGRLVRLALGVLCGWFVVSLMLAGPATIAADFPDVQDLWPWAFGALYLFSYVINIGFGRAWGHRPQLAVLVAATAFSLISLAAYGTFWGPPLGWFMVGWLAYTYAHLAVSFILSAILGTPGCEMRSIPHLVSLVTRRPPVEHHCPVGPLAAIDAWESGLQGDREA